MKKVIFSGLILAFAGIGVISCEKEINSIKSEENIEKQVGDITYKSQADIVTLENDLSNLNNYLFEMENQSNGHFLSYWSSHPTSTLTNLETAGYINESTMLSLFSAIESSADAVDDEDVVWNSITNIIDPLFVDTGNGVPLGGIIIFRCDNCLDGIKGNAVYTSFCWTWGPGKP